MYIVFRLGIIDIDMMTGSIFIRSDVFTASFLTPALNELTGTLTFSGIGSQYLTVTLFRWTFTHVQLASIVIISRIDFVRSTFGKK